MLFSCSPFQINAVFQFNLKSGTNEKVVTLDLKNQLGSLVNGASKVSPDIVITVADSDFVDLAQGKLNGQKAFMQGKIKVKGNVMLATKLDGILKPSAKL